MRKLMSLVGVAALGTGLVVAMSTGSAVAALPATHASTTAALSASVGPTTRLGKATGSPVTIGFINQQAGSVATDPEATVAAQAAVSYINDQLDGVNGHPIKLDTCFTDGTVATSQSCAQQMVADKPLFVIGGIDDNEQAWYSILKPAGLYVLGSNPLTTTDFTTDDAFNWSGGDATQLSALPAYIHAFLPKAKNVGILTINLPGAVSSLPLIQKPLEHYGIKVKTVTVPSSQTNWLAPYISLEHEDAILLLPVQQDCITVAQSAKSQNSHTPIVTVATCNDPSVFKAVGSDMNGWTTAFYGNNPSGNTAQAKLFRYVMSKYGGSNPSLGGFAPSTYSNVMTDYLQVLKPLGYSKLTVANVVKQAKDPAGGTVALFGNHYNCSGTLPFAAVCGYQVNYFDFKGSSLVNQRPFVSVEPTLKLAGI
jgi:branched-chain amino acid transport system substrate-binding protein